MHVQPYLNFDGSCAEALDFYKKTLGAEINMMMRFADSPTPPDPGMVPPGSEDKIMHAQFMIGASTIMASDGRCTGKPMFQGVSLSVSADDDSSAERMFAELAQGGQVQMAMTTTFFAARFGMVADKFGVSWMIISYPK